MKNNNEMTEEKNVPFCEDMEASSKCPTCGCTRYADSEYHFTVKCDCENEQ